jgi:hypothetical protein
MTREIKPQATEESEKIAGALEVLGALREDFERWLGEAQDGSKRESLENVLNHIVAMEIEYQRRRQAVVGE